MYSDATLDPDALSAADDDEGGAFVLCGPDDLFVRGPALDDDLRLVWRISARDLFVDAVAGALQEIRHLERLDLVTLREERVVY